MEIRYDKVAHGVRQLQHELATYLHKIPALMWHVDTVRNEMVFFNDHKVPGLDGKISLMLKNLSLAQSLVHPDDFQIFYGALDCVRTLQPATVSFRVSDDAGNWHWLIMLGMPAPDESFCYVGLITECTALIESIQARDTGLMPADSMELFDNPSLLIDFSGKKVIAANAAAHRFFGYKSVSDFPPLDAMMEGSSERYRRSIYEHLIFNSSWSGSLTLSDASGVRRRCSLQLRPLARDGKNFLWVSIDPITPAFAAPMFPEAASGRLYQALDQARTEIQALQALLDHQPEGLNAEAIMLSHIYTAENRVEVTGVGVPFKNMEPHSSYPYAGSIAENIVQYALPHIVVEETIRSIRPIDWALFIPVGIHSYYAEPYYEDNRLVYVLIYCSTKPAAFSASGMTACKETAIKLAETIKKLS